jgi:predicted ArsR family transcriptional regulator
MNEPRDDLTAVGLLDEPVRRALYDWVVRQETPPGREQAAQAVGTTRSLAAFHLEKLVDAGLLHAGYKRLTGRSGPGAGRPARVYWRAPREFSVSLPERHYATAASILADAIERLGDGPAAAAVGEAAREAGRAMALPLNDADAPGDPSGRLLQALTRAGYEPVTDADGTIRLRNCPFDALARTHQRLVCGANLALAEGLREATGASEVQPVLDPQPGLCCVAFVRR